MNLEGLITAIAFTGCIFVIPVVLGLFMGLSEAFSKDGKATQKLTVLGDKVIANKKLFDFDAKREHLLKMGITEKFPSYLKPHIYLLVHALGSIGGMLIMYMLLTMFGAPIVFCIVGVLGWFVPDLILESANKNDNASMSSDILTLLNVASSQISGGIYIGNAFEMCIKFVKTKRMKKALMEFSSDVNVAGESLKTAINNFESKFDNDEISSFCTVIRAYEENGHALEALNGLKQQIVDEEDIRLEREKERIERTMTIAILMMFGSMAFFIIYIFLSNIQTLLK